MEKRKNPMDSIENLSEEELKQEADSVREMIEQTPELQDVKVPEEVHQRFAERIRRYEEEEKALEGLSERDKEALRLGREIQRKNEENKMLAASQNVEDAASANRMGNQKIYYRPKKKKVLFMLAAVLVVVLGMGLTSVGRKNIIVDVFQKKFGSGDKTYVDTQESTLPTTAGGMSEEEAYAEIEKEFGTKVVQLREKPENTKFLEMQLDQELQEAVLYYLVDERVFSYRILIPYVRSSSGMEIQDELVREYNIQLSEVNVLVSEYKVSELNGLEYTAKFTYKNAEYFLQGVMRQEDFEKIIKNLIFF